MRLKKIVVYGFKSFADRVSLNFSEGITAIVGPNGCGKSNVGDAFRWVTGVQSAKSVRGARMDDMIFAGARTRAPMNYAEVSLTFTDVQGELAVDFEEVTITRRLYRTGESEYLLNGNAVRLKDIQSLLWDTGNSFSNIGQGKIEQMVTSKPTERRPIFEEAAGISRFRARKKEAQGKLNHTMDNLSRVGDIFREVEQQVEVLEKQATKAREFKKNKLHLERLEKAVLLARWEAADKAHNAGTSSKEQSDKQLHECRVGMAAVEEELAKTKEKLRSTHAAGQQEGDRLFKAQRDCDVRATECRTLEERLEEMVQREGQLKEEMEELSQQRKVGREEFDTCNTEAKTLKKRVAEEEKILAGWQKEVAAGEKLVATLRQKQKSISEQHFTAVQTENQTKARLQECQIRLESAKESMDQMAGREAGLADKQKDLTAAEKAQEARVAELSNIIDEEKAVLKEVEEQLKHTVGDLSRQEASHRTLQQEMTEKGAKLKALHHLKEQMEGLAVAAKKLLQESASRKSKLHGKLKPLFEVVVPKKGSEDVVAAALQRYMQTLVVQTREDLELVLQFAKKNQLKECSFVCVEELREGAKDPKLAEGGPLAAHFLQGIDVCDEWQTEMIGGSGEVVTKDGYFRDAKGVIFRSQQGEGNVFAREAELKVLSKELQEGEVRSEELRDKLETLKIRQQKLQSQKAEKDRFLRKEEMTLVEENFSLQSVRGDLRKVQEEAKGLKQERETLTKAMTDLTKKVETLTKEHEGAAKKVETAKSEGEVLDKELETNLTTLKEKETARFEADKVLRASSADLQRAEKTLEIFQVKDQEHKKQREKLETEKKSSIEDRKALKEKLAGFRDALKTRKKELDEATKKKGFLDGDAKKILRSRDALEKRQQQLQREFARHEKDSHQSEVKLTQHLSQRNSHAEELYERFQLTVEDAKGQKLKLDQPLEEAEKAARSLRREVEHAGDVNMAAIDDYERLKVRANFLTDQQGDLKKAQKELEQIVAKLEGESRKMFRKTFEEIRGYFKENFTVLFNGGEADLKLTDHTDILEAGIDIIAQPPGKHMRSINLLSGGEKCLTAIALLFALFEVKRAPFCILDEIDAPLDDANVERFVNLVKKFSESTQFIIVTHNKRTMAAADILFGISMQEKGVSKLLQMDFEDEKEGERKVSVNVSEEAPPEDPKGKRKRALAHN